jgi:hydroxymethylbilane synthase
MKRAVIATRRSRLALWQAEHVKQRLEAVHAGLSVELLAMSTRGDELLDRRLEEAGGKGLFVKELENALADGRADLAVHSMKDVPTELPEGLVIAAILPREDVRDAFVSLAWPSLSAMPPGARVGTSSLRRGAQVLRRRPDIVVVPFRGNVETRLRKLAEGEADATLLACAGLRRLGLDDRISAAVAPEEMLPAVAQGAIGIEIRAGDSEIAALIGPLDDPRSSSEVAAERVFLARLEGSCRTPIAALARVAGDRLVLDGEILTPDGRIAHATRRSGQLHDLRALATDAAEELRGRGGPGFFIGG